ncbi:Basic helix-loop-helix transcription factor [Parasponia andersonii]|uniref:Basic helix-loop-helix transcription factor n=1 Tax=Parasponia andersonii TaxID=3476 RepID=A0A2P5CZM4_PARAD|nr:Basic helix-loop-helix transcription factor [Parasponia andersonii]
MENINEFHLHDFIADSNFDQFIDLIRGENEDQVTNFACGDLIINGSNLIATNNDRSMDPIIAETENPVFGFDAAMSTIVPSDPNSLSFIGTLPEYFDGEIMMVGEDDDENDGEDSSGTTTNTTTTKKRPKLDRSRTLISERRRRGRMKEKLYALRSLVPNITKMDKASIVGDAVLYVQDLQTQAKKIRAEIASLEASLEEAEKDQGSTENSKKIKVVKANDDSVAKAKTITQIEMFQVEERGFYVKVVSNKGEKSAISLYKALESLTNFNVQSSNLATVSDTYVLTFTLNVKCDQQEPINLPNLKLWVTGAFLNQGFELKTASL